MSEFHRVRRLPPYVFEQVNRLKAGARAAGAELERRAETHGEARLREIECESGNADATKCPQ